MKTTFWAVALSLAGMLGLALLGYGWVLAGAQEFTPFHLGASGLCALLCASGLALARRSALAEPQNAP